MPDPQSESESEVTLSCPRDEDNAGDNAENVGNYGAQRKEQKNKRNREDDTWRRQRRVRAAVLLAWQAGCRASLKCKWTPNLFSHSSSVESQLSVVPAPLPVSPPLTHALISPTSPSSFFFFLLPLLFLYLSAGFGLPSFESHTEGAAFVSAGCSTQSAVTTKINL